MTEPPALILAREITETWAVPTFPVSLSEQGGKWEKKPLMKWGVIDRNSGVFEPHSERWEVATAVGVPMGARSGLLTVDLDDYKGKAPQEWLKAHGAPETRVHGTASGGRHLIFEMPDGPDLGNHAPADVEGLDIRGTGGFIIWADLLGRYKVIDDLDPARLPESMARELVELREKSGTMPLDDRELPAWRPQDIDGFETIKKLERALANATDLKFIHRWDGGTLGMKDTSASAMDMAMASMLASRGFNYNQIVGLLLEAFEHGAAYRDQDDRAAVRCAFRAFQQNENEKAKRMELVGKLMRRSNKATHAGAEQ
ncbi:MAG: bifunctional DNA primase/polymerase [Pseudomonadota bacterium]